jgi:hypothetical protein
VRLATKIYHNLFLAYLFSLHHTQVFLFFDTFPPYLKSRSIEQDINKSVITTVLIGVNAVETT